MSLARVMLIPRMQFLFNIRLLTLFTILTKIEIEK